MSKIKTNGFLVFGIFILVVSLTVCRKFIDEDGLFTEDEEDDGNPYTDSEAYFRCVKNHSNLADVLNFVHTPINSVPEHVFCAYLCMAEDVAFVLDGDIYPDRLMHFPARRKIFNWTDYIETKECLKVLHCRVTKCMDWRDPMICMSPNLLVDGSLNGVFNPATYAPDPYVQTVDYNDIDDEHTESVK